MRSNIISCDYNNHAWLLHFKLSLQLNILPFSTQALCDLNPDIHLKKVYDGQVAPSLRQEESSLSSRSIKTEPEVAASTTLLSVEKGPCEYCHQVIPLAQLIKHEVCKETLHLFSNDLFITFSPCSHRQHVGLCSHQSLFWPHPLHPSSVPPLPLPHQRYCKSLPLLWVWLVLVVGGAWLLNSQQTIQMPQHMKQRKKMATK